MIANAKKSAFISDMKAYQEQIKLIATNEQIASATDKGSVGAINVGLKDQPETTTVISDLKDAYKANGNKPNEVIVQSTIMYYNYSGTDISKKRVKWCFESDIPVWGYLTYQDFLNRSDESDDNNQEIEPGSKGNKANPTSNYTKVGNTYANSPDLSNFNAEATYYVTYDSSGNNPTIAGRIDRIDPPDGWYDYGNKIWANVVTVTYSQVAYWTWIPKYVYKADSSNQSTDVKFVDFNGNCKDSSGNSVDVSGYNLPDSFKFGTENLYGYWISKYEVSDLPTDIIRLTAENESINVSSSESGTYTVFIDGEKKYTGALPHTFNKLKSNKMYDVCVVKDGEMLSREKIRPKKNTNTIDLARFNPEATYYVTYDSSGNNPQIAGRIDKVDEPDNWYDYSNKIWPNVATITNSQVSYWTWIPRYIYRTYSNQYVEVHFVDKSVVNDPSSFYKVPDSFTFNGVELNGYWVSKYEINDETPTELILLDGKENKINVKTTATDSATYDIYVNGKLNNKAVTLPFDITGLNSGTEYDICVIKNGSEPVYRGKKTTNKIEIDLAKFNADVTYYVTYDDSGNETLTSIKESEPSNWYDYAEKKWANIATKGIDSNGKETLSYWVYIPRYMYKNYSNQTTDVKFISTNVTNKNCGGEYAVPDSFTFNGVELPGYWISKYEVSDQ